MVKVQIGSPDNFFSLPESWPDVIASGRYLDVIGILASTPTMIGRDTLIAERVVKLYADDRLSKVKLPDGIMISAAMKIIEEVYPVLHFISSANPEHILTNNPLQEIRHGKLTYRGKGQWLEPMTGYEMEECAWAYAEYDKSGDINMLDKVIAVLYEPVKTGKTKKVYTIEEKQADLATLPPITKLGIKFWYESCESWWYHTYRDLYEGSEGKDERDSLSVSRLIRAIAGPKRGTVEDVRKMPRGEIYFELAELDRQYSKK